jgi:hypothetical protein
MVVVKTLVRLVAWLVGLFVLLGGLADIAGLIPHSNEMPPWPVRVISSLPSMVGGVILLTPMSRFLSGRRYALLAVGYAILVLGAAILAAQGIHAYLGGGRHWAVVPASLATFSIPLANALLLWWLHRTGSMPNKTIEPTR